jgi:GR25 family glycosyltransferase involved in LPS biosynthesis
MARQFSISRLDPWVINLDRRADRWATMQDELRQIGLDARRFSACTPDDWREPADSTPLMQGKNRKTLGNWLSHTFLIRTAAGTDRDVMVLEDDVFFAADFWHRLRWIERNLDVDWDILFLCGTFHADRAQWHPEIGRDVETTHMPHLLRAYGVWSNHGYIVRGRSAGKVLGLMREVMPQARGSDHALILVQPRLNAYVFVPGMVFQRDGETDVGEGRTEFSGFLKLGPYVYQKWMVDFDPLAFDWGAAKREAKEAKP